MNPISSSHPLPRSVVNCNRHPAELFTAFCPLCLCERLNSLENSSSSLNLPKSSGFTAPIRRTKSFSVAKNETLGLTLEPQRRSCDIRGRNCNVNTLLSLFALDDGSNDGASCSGENFSKIGSVFRDSADVSCGYDYENGGMRRSGDTHLENLAIFLGIDVNSREIVEDNAGKGNFRGGIWAAASIFTEKFQKWRRNQKTKKQSNFPPEKPISRQYIETQSEIVDCPFRRRSCGMDPRFSFEAPRLSLDEYTIKRNSHRMAPVSLPETLSPAQCNTAESVPGGSAQTRDYYADSHSHRRKKALHRSHSMRKTLIPEIDETRKSNARVSPTSADYFHGAKESRESKKWWSWGSLGFGNKELSTVSRENGVNRSKSCNKTGGSVNHREVQRSGRYSYSYSPCQFENGLLQLYLAPMMSSQRGGIEKKMKPNSTHSIATSSLRLYRA